MRLDLSGLRVTVMGLGVHGGGLRAAQYLVDRGAEVTVTDLRREAELAASIALLPSSCRTVFGRHETSDFVSADLVVKNPAVPRRVPLLTQARAVTTDIALFLAEWEAGRSKKSETSTAPLPLVAITGTKGKSTCSSITAHILRQTFPGTRLGGNITLSPLGFVDELTAEDPVVLELSSFQLGDLAFCRTHNRRPEAVIPSSLPELVTNPVVNATVSVITNIFEDHQDYYASMEAYVTDKQEVYRSLAPSSTAILPGDSPWTDHFRSDLDRRRIPAKRVFITASATDDEIVPHALLVPGHHTRRNARFAAETARRFGILDAEITAALATFPGVPHRLQTVATVGGARFVNDTAATIPEAARAAVGAYADDDAFRVYLIAGGSDKGLDPAPIVDACRRAVDSGGAVALLEGTATDRIVDSLHRNDLWSDRMSRFSSLADAVQALVGLARTDQGDDKQQVDQQRDTAQTVVLLSPGCASFGMFRNEFDRGQQFIDIVQSLPVDTIDR